MHRNVRKTLPPAGQPGALAGRGRAARRLGTAAARLALATGVALAVCACTLPLDAQDRATALSPAARLVERMPKAQRLPAAAAQPQLLAGGPLNRPAIPSSPAKLAPGADPGNEDLGNEDLSDEFPVDPRAAQPRSPFEEGVLQTALESGPILASALPSGSGAQVAGLDAYVGAPLPGRHQRIPATAVENTGSAETTDKPSERAQALERAKQLIDAGDLRGARNLLDGLIAAPWSDRAQAELQAGDLEGAAEFAARALENSPDHVPSLLIAGETLLRRARSGDTQDLCQQAWDNFARAPKDARALLGASRAARGLGNYVEALRLARSGVELWDSQGLGDIGGVQLVGSGSELVFEEPERTWVSAALGAWRAADSEPDAPELLEALGVLQIALRSPRQRDWAYPELASALIEAGRPSEARDALQRALLLRPSDVKLNEQFEQAARAINGMPAVVRSFARLRGELERRGGPDVGLHYWHPALALFEAALPLEGEAGRGRFWESEKLFGHCRERSSELAASCLNYEALCRTARGWLFLRSGEPERAEALFSRAAETYPGAGQLARAPHFGSAIQGLEEAMTRWLERGDVQRAAEVAQLSTDLDPDNAALARRAADVELELGDAEIRRAFDLADAALGKLTAGPRLADLRERFQVPAALAGTPAEFERFSEGATKSRRAALRAWRRSMTHLERSIEHDPAHLAARVLRSEIVLRRLRERAQQSELQGAEEDLLTAVELGQRLLADDALGADARFAAQQLWGDAHQLLGVLHFELRGEPARALPWFERSIAIGPLPRPEVSGHYLPACVAAADAAPAPGDALQLDPSGQSGRALEAGSPR